MNCYNVFQSEYTPQQIRGFNESVASEVQVKPTNDYFNFEDRGDGLWGWDATCQICGETLTTGFEHDLYDHMVENHNDVFRGIASEGGLGSGRKDHQPWMREITQLKTNKHKIPSDNMTASKFLKEMATENSMCGDCMDNFLIKASEYDGEWDKIEGNMDAYSIPSDISCPRCGSSNLTRDFAGTYAGNAEDVVACNDCRKIFDYKRDFTNYPLGTDEGESKATEDAINPDATYSSKDDDYYGMDKEDKIMKGTSKAERELTRMGADLLEESLATEDDPDPSDPDFLGFINEEITPDLYSKVQTQHSQYTYDGFRDAEDEMNRERGDLDFDSLEAKAREYRDVNGQYGCDYCDKIFDSFGLVIDHMATHPQEEKDSSRKEIWDAGGGFSGMVEQEEWDTMRGESKASELQFDDDGNYVNQMKWDKEHPDKEAEEWTPSYAPDWKGPSTEPLPNSTGNNDEPANQYGGEDFWDVDSSYGVKSKDELVHTRLLLDKMLESPVSEDAKQAYQLKLDDVKREEASLGGRQLGQTDADSDKYPYFEQADPYYKTEGYDATWFRDEDKGAPLGMGGDDDDRITVIDEDDPSNDVIAAARKERWFQSNLDDETGDQGTFESKAQEALLRTRQNTARRLMKEYQSLALRL